MVDMGFEVHGTVVHFEHRVRSSHSDIPGAMLRFFRILALTPPETANVTLARLAKLGIVSLRNEYVAVRRMLQYFLQQEAGVKHRVHEAGERGLLPRQVERTPAQHTIAVLLETELRALQSMIARIRMHWDSLLDDYVSIPDTVHLSVQDAPTWPL